MNHQHFSYKQKFLKNIVLQLELFLGFCCAFYQLSQIVQKRWAKTILMNMLRSAIVFISPKNLPLSDGSNLVSFSKLTHYNWHQHPPILKKGFNLNTCQFSREVLIQFTW
jgi:hypothetical protein